MSITPLMLPLLDARIEEILTTQTSQPLLDRFRYFPAPKPEYLRRVGAPDINVLQRIPIFDRNTLISIVEIEKELEGIPEPEFTAEVLEKLDKAYEVDLEKATAAEEGAADYLIETPPLVEPSILIEESHSHDFKDILLFLEKDDDTNSDEKSVTLPVEFEMPFVEPSSEHRSPGSYSVYERKSITP